MAVRELSGADSSVLDARAEAAEALVGRRDEALAEWRADVPRGVRSWEPLGSVIPLLLVEAPRDVVQQLIVADRRVAGAEMYVDTQEEPEDGSRISNASSTAIDGKEVASVIQAQQFYDAGFKGAGFAVVSEPGGDHIHVEHPGFLDDATGPRRALNCTGLPSATCSDWMDDETLTTTYDEHATAVASTLGGDVTENQDGILSGDQAERSSGVARDATIWGISGYGSSIHTLIGSEDIVAVNRSAGGAISCGSYSSGAFDVDAVYEMGVAFVKSAGNNNNDTGQPYAWEADCNVSSAGEASGAFVVGAYNLDAAIPADDPGTSAREDIPTGEGRLYDGSGYGGDAVDGYTRTLVDITAPALEQNAYPHYQWPIVLFYPDMYGTDWDSNGAGSETFCCTSSATPVVTGALVVYREWADSVGGLAHDPGILYVRGLLMGDRWDGLTSYLSSGYSARSGAGRIRMRRYDTTGLDGPYATKAGSVCVADGTVVSITFNGGNALSSDIDMLKAVTWFFRTEDDDEPVFNDVELAVEHKTTVMIGGMPVVIWVNDGRDNGTDDKRRVYLSSPTAAEYRIRLTGTSVQGTDAVCGSNSQRVHYAILAEDSDRESGENLDEVRTE